MMNKKVFLITGMFVLLMSALYSFGPMRSPASDAAIHLANTAESNSDAIEGPTPAGSAYRYPLTDTITNAEIDTITLPVNFISLYTGLFTAQRINLSGTTNVSMFLDESNFTSGTNNWYTLNTVVGTGATVAIATESELRGLRYRIRLVGSGTQSTRYVLNVTAKKKN